MQREYFDPNRLYDDDDDQLDLIAPKSKRAKWRSNGFGPAFLRFGRRIKYDGTDLNEWANSVRVEPNSPA